MYPNSYFYLAFLLVTVSAFWTVPARGRRCLVLLASVAAYLISGGIYLAIPLAMAGIMYVCSSLATGERRKPVFCGWGIALILAILGYFKYRDFAVANINAVLSGISLPKFTTRPMDQLPLGISFCAFTAIAFLIDTAQGRIKRQNALDITTFLCFWPTALAGPILRFRELGPQLAFQRTWSTEMLLRGLDRIVWGLVQKNLIANSLDSWVREGFMPRAIGVNSTVDNWFLAIAFGLQVYFDFASYTNLAIGAAQLIGVSLPENFRFPYHAKNPSDFWSRWHMSLSRWIRDYLFFPLSVRSGEGGPGYYLGLVAVMALVGLWHGAGWGFVAWGVMHALYLSAYRIWQKFAGDKGAWANGAAVNAFWRIFMLLGVMAAWVPFRSNTLAGALQMLKFMFLRFRFGQSYSINFYLVTLLIAAFCVVEPYLAARMGGLEKLLAPRARLGSIFPLVLRPALYAVGLFLFIVMDARDSAFIYFQF